MKLRDFNECRALKVARELKHRFEFPRKYARMREAMHRYRGCRDRKPPVQIRREIRLCQNYWECYPLHYFRYDLYRAQNALSEEELLDFVPEYFFYDLFLPRFSKCEYAILMDDKNVTAVLCDALQIRQPSTICKIVGGGLYDAAHHPLDFAAVSSLLANRESEKVFVKPAAGSGGYGIRIFDRASEAQYRACSGEILDEGLLRRLSAQGDFIVQWGIHQCADLAAVYPKSVNTFRIATENRCGTARILCATLRMGRQGKEVDNSAQDGIVVGVNIESGRLGELAGTEGCQYFREHPDTGFEFAGAQVPQWEAVHAFVLECARKLPFLTYLGWDIALADAGPLAIEVNSSFGIDHYQVIIGGLRRVLRIQDPKIYWQKPTLAASQVGEENAA